MVNVLFEGAKAFQEQLDEREALDNFIATCDGYRDKFCVRILKVSLICPCLAFLVMKSPLGTYHCRANSSGEYGLPHLTSAMA